MICTVHNSRDCGHGHEHVWQLEQDDLDTMRADLEGRLGMTLEEAAQRVRWCGCCFDLDNYDGGDWFSIRWPHIGWAFPEVEEIVRDVAARKYEQLMA